MSENGFLEPPLLQLRKRKRKNGPVEEDNAPDKSLVIGVEVPKKKKTMSKVTSLASVLSSTPMAKAFKRSMSNVRLSPAPSMTQSAGNSTFSSTPSGKFKLITRSSSTAKVLQTLNSSTVNNSDVTGTPESPMLLRRGGLGRNSSTQLTPYKKPQPTPNKQRPTRFWSDAFRDTCSQLSGAEIKLQEAIYELSCGEEDLVNDMNLLRKTYAESMVRFSILTQAEADLVFGKLYPIIPLHNSLACALSSLRARDSGLSRPIGRVVTHWVNSLRGPYVDYCSNLIRTKAFIDYRRDTDKDFNDFLQRCIESPFSRKLDLWSYLDVPRSRLVKYPLLLRQVYKFSNASAESAADMNNLQFAIDTLESVIRDVDVSMAEAKAYFTVSRLEWLDDAVEAKSMGYVRNAREELINGTLRNNRGTKLECHLLDTVLILGRPSSRMSVVAASSTASLTSQHSSSSLCSTTSTGSTHNSNQNAAPSAASVRPTTKKLQVYRTPIPTSELVVEDLSANSTINGSFNDSTASNSASGSKHGSFKSAFTSSSQPGRTGFRVSFRNSSDGQSHTLIAPDEHSKRQWLATLKKASGQHTTSGDETSNTTDSTDVRNETDSSGQKTAVTPTSHGKRVYSHNGKIAKSTSARVGLFQKNHKWSPRIKASLSHTALESVKCGGAAKKIRSSASAKKLSTGCDETNRPRPAKAVPAAKRQILADDCPASDSPLPLPPRALTRNFGSNGSLSAAAAVGRKIVRQQLTGSGSRASPNLRAKAACQPPPLPPRKIARPRTKSWGHLQETSNASYHGENSAPRRYVTRSVARHVSKSMSDLMEV